MKMLCSSVSNTTQTAAFVRGSGSFKRLIVGKFRESLSVLTGWGVGEKTEKLLVPWVGI